MRKIILRTAIALSAMAMAASASAATIVYNVTGMARGTLNGTAFNGGFSITSTADTTTRAPCMTNGMAIPACSIFLNQSASVDIAGLGSFSLTNSSISFVNNGSNGFGFSEIIPGMSGFTVNTFAFVNVRPNPSSPAPSNAFATWDGVSDLGPIATNLQTLRFAAPSVATSGGALVLNAGAGPAFLSEASFSATLQSAAVPEPTSWMMMIAGFGFIGSMLRRGRKIGRAVAA